MEPYRYRPLRFYIICFAVTWIFWIFASVISKSADDNGMSALLMLLGLTAPAVTAVITVLTSGNKALKADLRRKLIGFYRIQPLSILAAVLGFMVIVVLSILLSLLAGQSLEPFFLQQLLKRSAGGATARIRSPLISHGLRNPSFSALYGRCGTCPCSGLRVPITMD